MSRDQPRRRSRKPDVAGTAGAPVNSRMAVDTPAYGREHARRAERGVEFLVLDQGAAQFL